jgi:hypothetical protein
MIEWATVAKDLEPDGSLCDIYVPGASQEDWERVVPHITTMATRWEYLIDGEVQQRLPTAKSALAARPNASPVLRATIGGIEFACHFFASDEIEFDFVPNDITGPQRLQVLLEFVASLGRLTGKAVLVTPENSPALAFLRYDPRRSIVEYVDA